MNYLKMCKIHNIEISFLLLIETSQYTSMHNTEITVNAYCRYWLLQTLIYMWNIHTHNTASVVFPNIKHAFDLVWI